MYVDIGGARCRNVWQSHSLTYLCACAAFLVNFVRLYAQHSFSTFSTSTPFPPPLSIPMLQSLSHPLAHWHTFGWKILFFPFFFLRARFLFMDLSSLYFTIFEAVHHTYVHTFPYPKGKSSEFLNLLYVNYENNKLQWQF